MNKLLLSALISATLSSTNAFAASLDVHGEIKVNGNTVINENGQLVAPQAGLPTFSVAEYLGPVNVILYQEITTTNEDSENNAYIEQVISTVGADGSYSREWYNDNELVWQYQETLTDNGYTYVSGPSDECSGTITVNTTVPLAESFQQGLSYAHLTTENTTDSCYGESNSTDEYRSIYTVIGTTSYQLEASTLEQCILVNNTSYTSSSSRYSWSADPNENYISINQSTSLLTYCKDVGLVDQVFDNFRMKTTRVETLATASSKSTAITTPNIHYHKLMKANKARTAQ